MMSFKSSHLLLVRYVCNFIFLQYNSLLCDFMVIYTYVFRRQIYNINIIRVFLALNSIALVSLPISAPKSHCFYYYITMVL